MTKNIGILILLSGIITLGIEEYREILNVLYEVNIFFEQYLETIFSEGKIGMFLADFISLILVCTIITLIPVGINMLIFKKSFRWTTETFVIILIMSTSSIALQ